MEMKKNSCCSSGSSWSVLACAQSKRRAQNRSVKHKENVKSLLTGFPYFWSLFFMKPKNNFKTRILAKRLYRPSSFWLSNTNNKKMPSLPQQCDTLFESIYLEFMRNNEHVKMWENWTILFALLGRL